MDSTSHPAPPIHDLIARRYSPRAFSDRDVSLADVRSLLEAARWAASCMNEQPWRYIVAMRSQRDEFDALLGCLLEGNRAWAARAAVLMLSVARIGFASNNNPNRHAWHDVGQASATMAIQAVAMGLQIHQMAGFDSNQARHVYQIPDDYEPVAAIAIGYPGDPASLPDKLRERELAPRRRLALTELAYSGRFGQPLPGSKQP